MVGGNGEGGGGENISDTVCYSQTEPIHHTLFIQEYRYVKIPHTRLILFGPDGDDHGLFLPLLHPPPSPPPPLPPLPLPPPAATPPPPHHHHPSRPTLCFLHITFGIEQQL